MRYAIVIAVILTAGMAFAKEPGRSTARLKTE
jgi:hypothetical protein